MIEYKHIKDFKVDQIKILFRSVEWFSNYARGYTIAIKENSWKK